MLAFCVSIFCSKKRLDIAKAMNFLHIGKLAESKKNEKNTVKSMKNKKNPRNAQVTGILNIGDPAGVRTLEMRNKIYVNPMYFSFISDFISVFSEEYSKF